MNPQEVLEDFCRLKSIEASYEVQHHGRQPDISYWATVRFPRWNFVGKSSRHSNETDAKNEAAQILVDELKRQGVLDNNFIESQTATVKRQHPPTPNVPRRPTNQVGNPDRKANWPSNQDLRQRTGSVNSLNGPTSAKRGLFGLFRRNKQQKAVKENFQASSPNVKHTVEAFEFVSTDVQQPEFKTPNPVYRQTHLENASPNKIRNYPSTFVFSPSPKMNARAPFTPNHQLGASTTVQSYQMRSPSQTTSADPFRRIEIGQIRFLPQSLARDKFVYEGEFGPTYKKVAVKRILLDTIQDERELLSFERLGRHSNIIYCLGHEKDDHFVYVALELCRASVEQFIRESYLQEELQLNHKEMLRQMVRGLEYLHSCKIVHRDIKPSNILISFPDLQGKMWIKLADFGLSKLMNKNCDVSMSGFTGTLGWIAPEVAKILEKCPNKNDGKEKYILDSNIDIFSLGCVFFYVLTNGKHPFGESIFRDGNIQKNQYDLKVLEDMDQYKTDRKAVLDLVRRMIHQDPLQRPTATALLKHVFFWRLDKTLDFLMKAAEHVTADRKKTNRSTIYYLNELEENSQEILLHNSDWILTIDSFWRKAMERNHPRYNFSSVADLLCCIYNMKSSWKPNYLNQQNTMGDLLKEFCQKWMDQFPTLVYHTWKCLSSLRDEVDFDDFYDNSFNFFPSKDNINSQNSNAGMDGDVDQICINIEKSL